MDDYGEDRRRAGKLRSLRRKTMMATIARVATATVTLKSTSASEKRDSK